MRWQLTVPFWEGSTAFVIGGGPSLAELDLSSLQGQNVVAVNNAYQLLPWAPVMFFMDNVWFTWHKEKLVHFGGMKITTAHEYKDVPWLYYLERGPRDDFTWKPNKLNCGGCSGHGGISVSIRLGAKKIILFAFDMRVFPGNRHNWHNDHRRHIGASSYLHHFAKPLRKLAAYAETQGIEILNATPGSALDCWPIVDPTEWVARQEVAA